MVPASLVLAYALRLSDNEVHPLCYSPCNMHSTGHNVVFVSHGQTVDTRGISGQKVSTSTAETSRNQLIAVIAGGDGCHTDWFAIMRPGANAESHRSTNRTAFTADARGIRRDYRLASVARAAPTAGESYEGKRHTGDTLHVSSVSLGLVRRAAVQRRRLRGAARLPRLRPMHRPALSGS